MMTSRIGPGARILRPMAIASPAATTRGQRLAGYLFGLAAGAIWGTTGPLSTALYRAGAAITGIGFWRLVIGLAGFLVYGLVRPRLFQVERRAWVLVGLGGGALVALFEVAYQFGIAGTGVAGAAALLYIAPVLVAVLAKPLLGERLTPVRVGLAVVVMAGATLTVRGGGPGTGAAGIPLPSLIAGVAGGLLAMISFAGTTLLARYAVPRYGAFQVLFLEIVGGVVVLGVVLPISGHPPLPPPTLGAWGYVLLLSLGSVLAANFCFFAAVKRIDAALTSVAATIEPVVGTLLALLLFGQRLSPVGWLGLALVVGGVAASYLSEGARPA
jgi:drug/metabolite transporter, DME family